MILEERNKLLQSSTEDSKEVVEKAALVIRESIRNHKTEKAWPTKPSDLQDCAASIPSLLSLFLHTLLTGNAANQPGSSCSRVQRLMSSFAQDLVYTVSCGNQKPPKHILLPYAVKSLTSNVELIQILNRCGHGISYSQFEEIDTALCLQIMATESHCQIPLPENVHPHVQTMLAWDNTDRLEETLSGDGTSHRVNGTAVQANVFGPHSSFMPFNSDRQS